jgi:hypothetical protein
VTPDVLTCVESISAERLSHWRDGGLPASEAQHMREHTMDCPACRERLTGFERVADTLRGQRELEPGGRIWYGVRQRAGQGPAKLPRPPLGRALRGLAAAAAVLALVALFASVLGGHLGRSPIADRAALTASATTPGPTATPPASAFPGRLEVADGAAARQLSYAYVLANDVWIGWQGKQPFQATHLGLGADYLIWTIAWSQDRTLLLANETADVDATTARAWLIQLAPAFAVSEVAASSPLVRGCANFFTCQWVGHRFVVHPDRTIPNQYHDYHYDRIYDLQVGADVPSALDGQEVYALEVRGALVYYTSLQLHSGTNNFVNRIGIADAANPQFQSNILSPTTFSFELGVTNGWDVSADGARVVTWPLHPIVGIVNCSIQSCVVYFSGSGGAPTIIFTRISGPGETSIAPDGSRAAALGAISSSPVLQIVRQPLPGGTEVASAVPHDRPEGGSGYQDSLIGWSADSSRVFERQVAVDSHSNNVATSVFAVAAEGSAPATLVLTLHDGAFLFFAPNE